MVLALIPIIGSIASIFIGPVLAAGYYVGIRKLDETHAVEIGDFFKAFDNWVQLFLFALVSGLLVSLGFVLLILPGIWLAIAITLGYQIIVFGKLEFWDSLKASVKIVNKKWFHFFGLAIILGLINIVGALLLGIGLFITIPLTYTVMYACYKDIIGFGRTYERDVTDHLVDDQF